jgi:flavin reductase (DIM6/NTAB) family NADH-FMN oxidoreductase RutF
LQKQVLAPDDAAMRTVLGHFATGVAIITAIDGGEPVGMACNSFTSVSLDPPLVLFSCEKVARFHEAVTASGIWVASVLAASQVEASQWFALRGRPFDDQFAGFETREALEVEALVLQGCVAAIECRTVGAYEGGDHTVIVGEVVAVSVREPEVEPLLYYGGRYRTLGE